MARVLKKEVQWDRPSLCVTRPANKDLTIIKESGDMSVEIDVFDKLVELTLDSMSELVSTTATDLAVDTFDDFNEAMSIMLTGDDDEAEESERSTQNVALFSDVDSSGKLPTSLSQANAAKHCECSA